MDIARWYQILKNVVENSPAILSEGGNTADLARPLLKYVTQELGAVFAECWSVNPKSRELIWVAEEPLGVAPHVERKQLLLFADSMTGYVAQSKRIHVFDLDKPLPKNHTFTNPELLDALEIHFMLSIPIQTTGNPHQVLCVLNFYLKALGLPVQMIEKTARETATPFARLMASGIEAGLRERGLRSALALTTGLASVGKSNRLLATEPVCNELARHAQQAVSAQECDVYLTARLQKLKRYGSTTKTGIKRNQSSNPWISSGSTKNADKEDENAPPDVMKTFACNRENVSNTPQSLSRILLPIRGQTGTPQGVVALTRTMTPDNPQAFFNYDDVAVVDAMLQAFSPALATIQSNELQRFAMQKLSHELRVPVQTFQAILEGMETECRENQFEFKYPHFREAGIYCDLMRRLMREMDLVRFGPSQIPLNCNPIKLWQDIVMPLRRFITPLLRKYRFRRSQIIETGFEFAPMVDVDPGLLNQILFILVDNACKYYVGDSKQFYCQLRGKSTESGSFEIHVLDNGPGITEADAEKLFDYGWRGISPRPEVTGEGIGLWIAKAVAKRHGGDLKLASRHKPTKFVLQIPKDRVLSSTHRG